MRIGGQPVVGVHLDHHQGVLRRVRAMLTMIDTHTKTSYQVK